LAELSTAKPARRDAALARTASVGQGASGAGDATLRTVSRMPSSDRAPSSKQQEHEDQDRPQDRDQRQHQAHDPRERVADLIRGAGSVIALTGAGVSVPSGIPDFRSPGTGLWAHVDPMEVAHIEVFRRDPKRFWAFYGERFHTLDAKEPNRAHEILAEWESRGILDAVITQNIDGLHGRAGSRTVIEVHGTIATSSCPTCGSCLPLHDVRRRLGRDRDGIPRCDDGHPLKPDVILFGEELPAAALAQARQLAATADLMICVGTSLEVHPVSELPSITLAEGGQIAIVTKGSTDYDRMAAVRLDGDVVEELEEVTAFLQP
jgi:NAD-dependent deacetylase